MRLAYGATGTGWHLARKAAAAAAAATHFEVSVNDSLRVHVVDGLEDLLYEVGRVLFRVAALFDDSVEELAAVDSVCGAACVSRRCVSTCADYSAAGAKLRCRLN